MERCKILVKNFERTLANATAKVNLCFIRLMLQRLAASSKMSNGFYKEVVHEEVEHRPPQDILADLAKLETEIQSGMKDLEALLK